MSVLPILTWPDPRLSQACSPIEISDATRQLAQDMLDTMYAAPGRGLAAPQVGHLTRLFVMDATWKDGQKDPQVFFNPRIESKTGDPVDSEEGCLSIPGVTANVRRAPRIALVWQDADGTEQRGSFDGFAAACIQHEMDHLDGIVTLDRLDDAARADILSRYEGVA